MGFFGCEVLSDDDELEEGNTNSIVGTWRDNIEGNWIIIGKFTDVPFFIPGGDLVGNTFDVAILENPNYMLTHFNQGVPCDENLSTIALDDEVIIVMNANQEYEIVYECSGSNINAFYTYPGLDYLQYSLANECNMMNRARGNYNGDSGLGIIGANNVYGGGPLFTENTTVGNCMAPCTEFHEIITFYEDGTFVYLTSNVWPNFEPEYVTNYQIYPEEPSYLYTGFINNLSPGDVIPPTSIIPFEERLSGTYSITDGTLTLNYSSQDLGSENFSVQIDNDNLTLDRSFVGNAEYITTWEKQ